MEDGDAPVTTAYFMLVKQGYTNLIFRYCDHYLIEKNNNNDGISILLRSSSKSKTTFCKSSFTHVKSSEAGVKSRYFQKKRTIQLRYVSLGEGGNVAMRDP